MNPYSAFLQTFAGSTYVQVNMRSKCLELKRGLFLNIISITQKESDAVRMRKGQDLMLIYYPFLAAGLIQMTFMIQMLLCWNWRGRAKVLYCN